MVRRVEPAVRAYVSESPRTGYKQLKDRFGTPEQIVESYIAEMSTSDLREEFQIGKRMLNVMLISSTIVVLIWLIFAALGYYDVFKYENGYAEIEVLEIAQTDELDTGFSK